MECSSFRRIAAALANSASELDVVDIEQALRRRRFPESVMNACDSMSVISYDILVARTRNLLQDSSPSVMVVLLPLRVVINGRDFSDSTANVLQIPSRVYSNCSSSSISGSSDVAVPSFRELRMESEIFVDEMDFRMEDSEDYFGLAPGKIVGLKYAFRVQCESVDCNEFGEPVVVRCTVVEDNEHHSLSADRDSRCNEHEIQWVPASTAVPIQVRLYNHNFGDSGAEQVVLGVDEELSSAKETLLCDALADPTLLQWAPLPGKHFQFGSLGYFTVEVGADDLSIMSQDARIPFIQTVREGPTTINSGLEDVLAGTVGNDEAADSTKPVESCAIPIYSEACREIPVVGEVTGVGTMVDSVPPPVVAESNDAGHAAAVDMAGRTATDSAVDNTAASVAPADTAPAVAADKPARRKPAKKLTYNANSSVAAAPLNEDREDLSVLERRELTRQRIEREKQARLAQVHGDSGEAATAADASTTDDDASHLSVAERMELVRKRAEEERLAKLEQLKQATRAEFLGSAGTECGQSSGVEGDKRTVVERAQLAIAAAEEEEKRRLEAAKQAKLAEFLLTSSSTAVAEGGTEGVSDDTSLSPIGGAAKLSLAERARLAKLKAEQESAAKIEQMKQAKLAEFIVSPSVAQTAGDGEGDEHYVATHTPMSLAERTERARQKQEQERLARLEADKQAKLAGFLRKDATPALDGGGDSGNMSATPRDWESMTLAQRREAAKVQAEAEKQARLAEFLNQASSPTGSDGLEGAEGSLAADRSDVAPLNRKGSVKDRFENAKRLQAQQEEERLARLRNDPAKSVHRSHGSSSATAYSDAVNDANNSNVNTPELSASDRRQSAGRSSSLRNVWAEALNEQKTSEDLRVKSTKRQTIAQFRVTDGTGIVKRRIGEWEELFMQIAATAEQLEDTLRAARELSLQNMLLAGQSADEMREAQKRFREACEVPERFIIGATHIYNIKLMDFSIASYIKRSLADRSAKHFALSCGVYGDSAAQPPIEVYAAAIKTDDAYPSYYVALTIKAAPGHELDPEAYGVQKIAVVSSIASGASQKIMDLVVDIVPQEGFEGWVAEGRYEDEGAMGGEADKRTDREANAEDVASSAAVDLGAHFEDLQVDENEAVEEKGGRHEDDDGEDSATEAVTMVKTDAIEEQASGEQDSVSGSAEGPSGNGGDPTEDEVRMVISAPDENVPRSSAAEESATAVITDDDQGNPTTGGDRVLADLADADNETNDNETEEITEQPVEEVAQLTSSVLAEEGSVVSSSAAELAHRLTESTNDHEPDAEDNIADDVVAEPFNFGRTLSVAHVGMARSFQPSSPAKKSALELSSHTASKFSWSSADEVDEGLPSANLTTVYIDLTTVVSVHCSSNLLVLEGAESCTLFTGTLKSASTDSKYMVHGDKVFQWIRGAAISGWCIKWPMKSQAFGRRSRRFFVLRDNLLTYHNAKPENEEDVLANYSSKNSLVLTEETTVTIARHYFMRAMVVTTPADTLWIRFKGTQGNADKEARWKAEFSKAIQHQSRKKLFMSKTRVESMWYHESPHIAIVSIDAVSDAITGNYVKMALFCLADTTGSEAEAAAAPAPAKRRSSFSLSLTAPAPEPKSPVEKKPAHLRSSTMRRSSRAGEEDLMVSENTFSIDIGSSEADRVQLEILRSNESPFLPTNLSCVKIYGDVALLGGTGGFVGVGIVGRTSPSIDDPNAARKVMFCFPCHSLLSAAHSSDHHNAQGHDHLQRNTSETSKASSLDSVSGGGRGGRNNSHFGPVPSCTSPHSKYSTILCFASGQRNNVFAVADDMGTISLWYLEKTGGVSGCSSGKGKSQSRSLRPPEFQSSVSLGSFGSAGNHEGQRVIKMFFLPNDVHLVVCTNKRLLLLEINAPPAPRTPCESPAVSPRARKSASEETSHSVDSSPPTSPTTPALVRVTGWVELDRVAVGCSGVFAMHVEGEVEEGRSRVSSSTVAPVDAAASPKEEDSSSNAERSSTSTPPPLPPRGTTAFTAWRRIVQWKVTEDEDPSTSNKAAKRGVAAASANLSKCTIYRFEWSQQMFEAAMLNMKFI